MRPQISSQSIFDKTPSSAYNPQPKPNPYQLKPSSSLVIIKERQSPTANTSQGQNKRRSPVANRTSFERRSYSSVNNNTVVEEHLERD